MVLVVEEVPEDGCHYVMLAYLIQIGSRNSQVTALS